MPLSPKPRIALLEDDPVQAESLLGWLRAAGFEVAHFRAGYDLMASLRRHPAELLVLDKRVPDISGIDVLKWARADLSYRSPILIITSHDSEVDVVSALEAGADDYLQKPLRRAEFIARIEAAWRRHTGGTVAVTELVLGPYRLDRAEATASLHGQPIELTQKEFDIAWHLFRHVGSLVAREDLLRAVWGLNGSVQTRTLDVHMSRVRRKLALQPENGVRLQSIYSFGYRFDRTAD
jgi:DNA-binding response OmpR family regulator